LTYSYIGTRGFKARFLSPNSIFDIASSAIFSDSISLDYILGFLNSSLACFMLGVLNPTINFQIGDLRRLPFMTAPSAATQLLEALSQRAVVIAKELELLDPRSPTFAQGKAIENGMTFIAYQELLETSNEEEHAIQKDIDSIIFDIFKIARKDRSIVLADPWVSRSRQDLFKPLSPQQFEVAMGCR
jgi:hypothetical protein